jgi:L-ascorbate metabolism protein UlaG (beta-lactamase superfamily)
MANRTILRNKIALTWLGHASWRIRTPEGAALLIDAWIDTNPACPDALKSEAKRDVGVLFVTHGHFDHVNDIAAITAASPGAKVACQFDMAPFLIARGVPEASIVGYNTGGTIDIAGVRATMTTATHSSTFNQDGQIIALGEAIGYVLRFSNGFTIYHTGDTAVHSDMEIIGKLYKPDLVILPIGDFYTMGPLQAAYALKLIGATYALGSHWGSFPILTGTPDLLKSECKKLGVKTRVLSLAPGETLE